MYPLSHHSRGQRGVRIHLLRRFPYSVIYIIAPDEIIIVALAHHSRRPGYWGRRPI